MSDSDDSWGVLVFVAIAIMICFIFYGLGRNSGFQNANCEWRNRLIDNPDYVAAIKSEVLAERVVKALEE